MGKNQLVVQPREPGTAPASVFLACLGTGRYSTATYPGHEGESVEPCETRFIQVARLQALKARGSDLHRSYVLVTTDAAATNWEDAPAAQPPAPPPVTPQPGLKSCLHQAGCVAEPIPIPDGKNAEEFWKIFDEVARCIPEGADVYADLTHGFRTLPVLTLLALEYVERAKGAHLRELSYGAPPDKEGQAATWDLAPFLVVRDWASALTTFLEYGDTRPLARMAGSPTRDLKRVLRTEMHGDLERLPKTLEAFGEALLKCHAPSIARTASALRKQAAGAADECERHPGLKPLELILDKVAHRLADFPLEPRTPADDLRAQRAAARWCLQHGLAMQAFTFIREAYVTALALLGGGGDRPRKSQDALLGALGGKRHDGDEGAKATESWRNATESWVQDALRAWAGEAPLAPGRWHDLLSNLDSLGSVRNALNHAYIGRGAGKPQGDDELKSKGHQFLESLDDLITAVESREQVGSGQ